MARLNARSRCHFIQHYDRRLGNRKVRMVQRGRMRMLLLSRHFIPPLEATLELKVYSYFSLCIKELKYFYLWGGSLDKKREVRLLNVMLKLLLSGMANSEHSFILDFSLPKALAFDNLVGKRLIKTLILVKDSKVPVRFKLWQNWVKEDQRSVPDPYARMIIDLFGEQLDVYHGEPINASMFLWRLKPLVKVSFYNDGETSAATILKVPSQSIEFHSQYVPECVNDKSYPKNPHLKRLIVGVDFTKPLDVAALRSGLKILRELNPEFKLRIRSYVRHEEKNYGRDDLDKGGELREEIMEKMRKDLILAKEYIDASIDLFPILELQMCELRIRCYRKDPEIVREYAESVGFDVISKGKFNDVLTSSYAGAQIRIPVLSL